MERQARRWNSKTSSYTYFYSFGDLHIEHSINKEHTKNILSLLDSTKAKNELLVLIEDITSDPQSDNQTVKVFHENTPRVCQTSPMLSLVSYCLQRNINAISVDNLRFLHQFVGNILLMYLHSVSIEQLKQRIELFCGQQPAEIFAENTLNKVMSLFFTFHHLTISAIATEVTHHIKLIQSYNDNPVLQEYYTKITQTIQDRMCTIFGNKTVAELIDNNQTVFDYCLSLPTLEHQKEFIQKLFPLFNAEL